MSLFGGIAALAIDFTAVSVTLLRSPAGQYVAGIWTPGAAPGVSIHATVHASSIEEINNLPEGQRIAADGAFVTVWSRSELRGPSDAGATDGDIIQMTDGKQYRILNVTRRDEADFYRAIAGLINDRGRSV